MAAPSATPPATPPLRLTTLVKAADLPYYPPRAGRIGRRLNRWKRLVGRLQLERPAPTVPVRTWPRIALWLLIPGTLGLARGQRWLGTGLLGIWLGMLTAYWIWIGTAGAAWAYILASAIHSISATIVFATCLTHLSRDSRVWRASLYAFLLVLVLYALSPFDLARRAVVPIEVQGTTFLINTAKQSSELRRGDWIAYRIHTYGAAGFDRILALPGETIRFHEDAFEVGERGYRRVSGRMPTQGELTLSEREYFVWPAGARYIHGGRTGTEILLAIARVPEDRLIGAAYHRWLWRKQTLDSLVELKDWTPSSLDP